MADLALLLVRISSIVKVGVNLKDYRNLLILKAPESTEMAATAPNCRACHRRTVRRVTRVSNRTGNANRPYYKCIPCDKFQCFDDDRGKSPDHPLCSCNIPSRQQVAGPDKFIPRGLHYVCSSGACDFYGVQRDAQQQQITLDENLVDTLARLNII